MSTCLLGKLILYLISSLLIVILATMKKTFFKTHYLFSFFFRTLPVVPINHSSMSIIITINITDPTIGTLRQITNFNSKRLNH